MCQHPNVIRLIDFFENESYHFIVLEHCKGKNLYDYLQERDYQLPEKRVCEIIEQMSQAVQYFQQYGIIHRDLKLENIMMSDDSDQAQPKIIDFGLARVIGPTMRSDEPFGTLGYVAPEVLKKEPYNFTCDVWSIGCIAYALLSGSLPFDHQSPQETVRMTLKDPLVFDLPCWKLISEKAQTFITGCLVKDPNRRLNIDQVLKHPWFAKIR